VLGGVWWTIAIKMSSALFTLQLTLVNWIIRSQRKGRWQFAGLWIIFFVYVELSKHDVRTAVLLHCEIDTASRGPGIIVHTKVSQRPLYLGLIIDLTVRNVESVSHEYVFDTWTFSFILHWVRSWLIMGVQLPSSDARGYRFQRSG
jgi:hypothetical protein